MAKTFKPIPPILNQQYAQVSVDLLKLHPRNARQGDVGQIYESIEANGFYGACVVQRSTNHVLVGNHRLMAARQAGIPSIPVVYVDVDNDRALRILLSDNKTADDASYNDSALAELLTELAKTPEGLTGTAFTGDELDQLINDLARENVIDRVNTTDDWVGMPEFEAADSALKIIIQFEKEEDREEFAKAHDLQFLKKHTRAWSTWYPFRDREDVGSLTYDE